MELIGSLCSLINCSVFKILKYQNTKYSESVYVEKCLCVYDSLIVMLVFLRSLMSFDILSTIKTFEFDKTFPVLA